MNFQSVRSSVPVLALVISILSCGDDSTGPDSNTPVPVTILNPDFEILYKAGSTTVTAPPLPAHEFTLGTSNLGMSGPTVTFSDNSTGNAFDLPGWTFTLQMGLTNEDSHFNAPRGNVVWFNGASYGGGSEAKSMSQVLSEALELGTTYTLTADFGWRTDNSAATMPPILNLYAGGTLLVPTTTVSPPLVQGSYVTYSRTYLVTNTATSGALKVEIGLGPNSDGQQLNADRVTLKKL